MSALINPSRNTDQRGFSLIEVLVALLVLSIGLLGLAALQTTSLKYNTDSYLRTQATFFVYDIFDRMRANSAAVADGGTYDVDTTVKAASAASSYPNCDSSACDAANLAAYDLGKWYERIRATLPGTTDDAYLPTIDVDASDRVTIIMQWKERDMDKSLTWIAQL